MPLYVGDAFIPLFTVSAISPKYLNKPTFYVWEYDKTTYEIIDLHAFASTKVPLKKWSYVYSATK